MDNQKVAVAAGIVALAATVAYLKPFSRRAKLPLPPGPPGLPIIGNAFDIPSEGFCEQYKKWSEEYGESL